MGNYFFKANNKRLHNHSTNIVVVDFQCHFRHITCIRGYTIQSCQTIITHFAHQHTSTHRQTHAQSPRIDGSIVCFPLVAIHGLAKSKQKIHVKIMSNNSYRYRHLKKKKIELLFKVARCERVNRESHQSDGPITGPMPQIIDKYFN